MARALETVSKWYTTGLGELALSATAQRSAAATSASSSSLLSSITTETKGPTKSVPVAWLRYRDGTAKLLATISGDHASMPRILVRRTNSKRYAKEDMVDVVSAQGDTRYCDKQVDGDVILMEEILEKQTDLHVATLYIDRPMCNCCGSWFVTKPIVDKCGNVLERYNHWLTIVVGDTPYRRRKDAKLSHRKPNESDFQTVARNHKATEVCLETNNFPVSAQNIFGGIPQHD
eukprot:TRINITY_DN808_c1_g1_i4.p1 TRINITY_DN808_c1_g1~~TRINITY_DN808_c1_g1_i4.p1  ORF type:complete len:232 (-),score=16.09 TRINITY_DN808_c1_g1_i4:99-794(-)